MNSSCPNSQIRIGIISLYYNSVNYGGLAQAYALNTFLNGMGYNAELISYKRMKNNKIIEKESLAKKLLKSPVKKTFWKIVCKVSDRIFVSRYHHRFDERTKKLKEFRDNRIQHSEVFTEDTLGLCKDNYEVFISGSDQIWKPGVVDDGFVFNFLNSQTDKLIFSYASSVSVDTYPEAYIKFMKASLNKYALISVREKSTAKQFKEFLGRDVFTCVDPTLLVDRKVWYDLASERLIQGKYLFCYLLGDDLYQRKQIKKFARANSLKLVTIPHIKDSSRFEFRLSDVNFGDEQIFDVGIEDFLSLIQYASFVITDSFHAGVFSYVFRKEFLIMERPTDKASDSMNVRVYDLMELYGLKGRIIKTSENLDKVEVSEIDYDRVQFNVDKARKESIHYMDSALNKVVIAGDINE